VVITSWTIDHHFEAAKGSSLQIHVGANPVGLGYNHNSGNIYVANSGSHSISVINGETNRVDSTVLVGRIPYAVAYNPINDHIYVTNLGENSVSVIDGGNSSITETLQVGTYPSSVNLDVSNQRIYVSNYFSNYVSVIDAEHKISANVSVGKNPIDLAINPSHHGVYVANAGSNTVSIINGATNKVISNVTVGEYPTAVAYNPTNNKVYVANRNSGNISVIDGDTNTLTNTIKVDPFPLDVAVNPNTNTIYVAHTQNGTSTSNDQASSNTISVIDGATNEVKKIEQTSPPERMVVNLKNNNVYVTNPKSGYVSVVDGKTNQVLSEEPSLPWLVKFSAITYLGLIITVPLFVITLLLVKRTRDFLRTRLGIHHWLRRRFKKNISVQINKGFQATKKGWILSGLALSILSMIVMPVLVVLSVIHYNQITIFFTKYSQYQELEWEKILAFYITVIVQIAFVATLLLYPPYPAPFSAEHYFRERGYNAAVVEYDYVKKILYVAVPLFIILTILPLAGPQLQPIVNNYLLLNLETQFQDPAFKISQAIVFLIVFSGLIKLIFAIGRKKFRLYYAIGCFWILRHLKPNTRKDEVQKLSYVIKGLNSYNMYLHRHLNLHISGIRSIYSKISALPREKKDKVIEGISESFSPEQVKTDSLGPARFLYEFATGKQEKLVRAKEKQEEAGIKEKQEEAGIKEKQEEQRAIEEGFLTSRPLFAKIKDLAALVAVVIPLGIAIIELYFRILTPD
jgi:YVTN family beta-propeller protein